ncbi:cytochrome c-type biogenesis protein CcmH [Aquisalimonas lutea]|uniref:cytochrome c-type biogenesis protein n=1 Tax=Aquisalimonas lutea TaxID=1327750 RepID=UPI0025B4AF58|nr:cytochrome c-type biogenesis protein [Aquisalimonas lutea]MDN3519078.1 cytochrome c-type biogenesis protein CcmH [Aquisalimonas lutea]
MISLRWLMTALLILAVAATAFGKGDDPFADPEREARFRHIAQELRCLVCQGESILDSNADLAKDMRAKVRELMREGRSDEAIRRYMTERYGDFVLFRPPLKPATWVLWFAPALLGITAVGVALVIARRRSDRHPQVLSPEEHDRLRRLLDDENDQI